MQGQWQGNYQGSNSGLIIVDVDDRGTRFVGHARLFDTSHGGPLIHAVLETADKSQDFSITPGFFFADPHTGATLTPTDLAEKYPGFIFPTTVEVKGKWTDSNLKIEWKTNIGTFGSADLPASSAKKTSEYTPNEISWTEFKSVIGTIEPRRCIFRGQEQPWRLRSSFHRTQRADLVRFRDEDIPTLYRVLSARTRHIYDLRIPDQNGAFYHLVQHHGYPTPLLDWTYSPFVAAFCAYRKIGPTSLNDVDSRVRIFVFDQAEWRKDWEQIQDLTTHKQNFSILEFVAIDNERMVPQQALSCLSNIDDIETYVRQKEAQKDKSYLRVFDLPAKERQAVMLELSVMGITAGSMFPGLDGSCEEIRERLFPFSRD